MASRAGIIGLCGVSGPHLVALINELEDLVICVHKDLLQALDLNRVVLVFSLLQLLVFVEQIVEFASVNLVHGHSDSEVALMVLPVVDAPLK